MQEITFDGYEGQFLVCPYIDLWRDYSDRAKGIVTAVKHGSKGILLERRGNRCKVQAGDKVGYLTFYFIREEKKEWQSAQEQGG